MIVTVRKSVGMTQGKTVRSHDLASTVPETVLDYYDSSYDMP